MTSSDPLALLATRHRRSLGHCRALRRLMHHVQAHGNDARARATAAALLRHFDTVALPQHATEEDILFPAVLEAVAGSDPVCIRDLLDTLAQEHRRLEAGWRSLRKHLVPIAAGTHAELPSTALTAFSQAYAQHVETEDFELLPMAQRLLDQHQIDALAKALRAPV